MRYLRLGCKGDDVTVWSQFLRGLRPCSTLVVSKVFTPTLHAETKIFQRAVGFTDSDVDGIVGPRTVGKATELGFDPMIDDSPADVGPNWPPRLDRGPMSYLDRSRTFGQFPFTSDPQPNNPEAIKILGGWVGENIERVKIPQLVGVTGAAAEGDVWLHKLAAQQFVNTFKAWEDAGLKHLLLTFNGSWVPRFVRGSRSHLSNHAWGTAIDINYQWNTLGAQPALKGERGSVRELVSIAADHGLFWGGWYKSRKDGMHFEIGEIR